MRELTKSMLSYSWAMSVFGVQQFFNLAKPGEESTCKAATQAFDNVTNATTETFGGVMKQAFRAGDSLQRGMIDVMLGGLSAGGLAGLGREAAQKMAEAAEAAGAGNGAASSTAGGAASAPGNSWGPMPQ